jgi:hypothetical protein
MKKRTDKLVKINLNKTMLPADKDKYSDGFF